MTHSAHILALATRTFAEQEFNAEVSRIGRRSAGRSWLRSLRVRR